MHKIHKIILGLGPVLSLSTLLAGEKNYLECQPGGTNCKLTTYKIEDSTHKYEQDFTVTYDLSTCDVHADLSTLSISGKEMVEFHLWWGRKATHTVTGYELALKDVDPKWTSQQNLGTGCKLTITFEAKLSENMVHEYNELTPVHEKAVQLARKALGDNAYYQSWSKRITSEPDTWSDNLKVLIKQLRDGGNEEKAKDLEDVLLGNATLDELQKTEKRLVCKGKETHKVAKSFQDEMIESTHGASTTLRTALDSLSTTLANRVCTLPDDQWRTP